MTDQNDGLVPPVDETPVYETETPVLYEAADGIAWVTLNRPQYHNVQNSQMTYALDDAFFRAVDDDAVKVIVLKSDAKHFSAVTISVHPDATFIRPSSAG